MNITLSIPTTSINSVIENITTIIRERLVSSLCTADAFLSGIDDKREDIDMQVEFNNLPIYIENSSVKFMHLSLEVSYEGVKWKNVENFKPSPPECFIFTTGQYSNNILWSTGELEGSGDHNEPIQLLTEELDIKLSEKIMECVLENLTEVEVKNFKDDIWNKHFNPSYLTKV